MAELTVTLSSHVNFSAHVTCVECGWEWDGWLEYAAEAALFHAEENGHG